MKYSYTVMTAHCAGHPRRYGYVVKVNPPIITVQTYLDVEGIGYHAIPPRRCIQLYQGWYKNKERAVQRAAQLNASQSEVK